MFKKRESKDTKIPIFGEACDHKLAEYWQFRSWLIVENKYVSKSLHNCNEIAAIELGEAGHLQSLQVLSKAKPTLPCLVGL